VATWRQSAVLVRIELASLGTHVGTSLVIVIGMACVVGVMASTLAMRAGLVHVYDASGDARRALVLSEKSPSEYSAVILPSTVGTILDGPGLAKDSKGQVLGDAEVLFRVIPPPGAYWPPISVEGIGAQGTALRPNFRVVAGRMFKPGLHEMLIGRRAQSVYRFRIGDPVTMRNGDWKIAGVFTSGGDVLESGMLADAVTLMASEQIGAFGSVLVQLERPAAFESFEHWLSTNPAFSLTAERQAHYYARVMGDYLQYLNFFAYFVGAIMSLGALLGSINIFYGVVSTRRTEIATFRAVGYRALPVAASLMIEAVALSLLGAVVGLAVAWLLFDGRQTVTGAGIFNMAVSPQVMALCAGWVVVLSVVGSLAPALRAARLPVSVALRAT
jgi:putative ABC transport system permease protein